MRDQPKTESDSGKINIWHHSIDDREVLRCPSEIKTGISPSETKTFILLWCHSTNFITIENIIGHLTLKNKFLFSSPGPKVHVNYCHHLASFVCKLFTFQASSPKPLGQLEPNLTGMFLGWSSTNFLFFVPVGYSTWLPGPIICSDRLKFQRSFRSSWIFNMAARANNMLWSAEISKIFFSETVNEWSLECPLPSFCFLCRLEIQDGRQHRT
jgi:hypothetical protein